MHLTLVYMAYTALPRLRLRSRESNVKKSVRYLVFSKIIQTYIDCFIVRPSVPAKAQGTFRGFHQRLVA